jgi:hypothetical protein
MKRAVVILFSLALAGLFVWLWLSRSELSFLPETRHSVRTIVPTDKNDAQESVSQTEESAIYDESKILPLIVLESDETFLQAIAVDLNKDGAQDQICAVKTVAEPNIYLIPGLQNPLTGEYSRIAGLRTGITQSRTLLFYTMDIIGDRTEALVYSGMTADNIQLLAVYLPVNENDGKVSFLAAADLRSDGPITIQEVKRSDAYNLGLTNGESYPIYTYNSDPDSPQTLDQIERIYRWDKMLKRYEQISESRIAGKKIETQLIRQLQGGDLNTFENFLTGLWYTSDASAKSGTKDIYFNMEEKEIIFHNGSTEEVYIRESGAPRRYGAYLTTRNSSIPSIRRLIDIELIGIDEIKIKILEDVKLKIGVASDWDGVYRKLSSSSVKPRTEAELSVERLKEILASSTKDWISTDGQKFQTDSPRYSLSLPTGTETGLFILLTVKGKAVMQFKPESAPSKPEFYLASAEKRTTAAGEQQLLTLTKVTVSMDGTNLAGSPPVVFERIK